MLSRPLLASSLWPPIFPSVRVSLDIYFVCTVKIVFKNYWPTKYILFLLSI